MKAKFDTLLSMDSEISESILNSLGDQICLIDRNGTICFTNQEWNRFGLSNGTTLSSFGIGANYLRQCEEEPAIFQGLQAILTGDADCFNFEYPCHSPAIKRWFLMQATPLQANNQAIEGVVIRHVDITKQKLLELQLKEYAEKDSLTSLFNRRYFEEQVIKEVSLSRQRGMYLSLLYIDVDNFKEINDGYGHPAGDRVLQELALQISDATRFSDTAARIGGDEFALLLPDTNKIELTLLANKLSLDIQQLKIQEQSRPIDVTVSIGGKSFIGDFPLNSMAQWADKALYLAKDKGKNQVVIL
ncbi:diguanylate cyclase domain-containing protein [Planococcus antarcticus DSM 14505]|uniref:Diguanylate cyclase domain-containing protein n=2 Tax=Planococcus TaxID=1372 RepID=A0A1C7DL48_9BACL|nr:sensor domain-containing diguanylate cyclase [Planococcus antarcticus]ANU12134.1 GGDEF domain-containing protein [Planococcus antarcticus DSM 14505]EIM06279.1 diguanylate cyclase domain-containing protein [Planococcus antarcticus DSM 14505]